MTDEERYEIACLADDLHTKRENLTMLRMMNTPDDPDKRRRAAIDIEIADTEVMQAESKLKVAKVRLTYGFSHRS